MSGDPSDVTKINLAELEAHHQRLTGVIDRIDAAAGAAQVPFDTLAFGLLGEAGLGGACRDAVREGYEMVRSAADASRDHHQRVRSWRADLDRQESDAVHLFSTVEVSGA